MSKRFIFTLATLVVIGLGTGVAIFFAKGYTFNPKEQRIVGTGIISVASTPDAASIYIDGHLTSATNATISTLTPKEYTVRVVKEGFIPWEKKVEVKEGLVTDLKITLFPAIPTVYPLTFTGVKNPSLSPDGSQLAYIVPTGKKAGVWVWTFESDRPIAFARGAQPHQIAQSTNIDYSSASLRWSADSKQVIATIGANNYLLEDERLNTEPRDITPILQATLKSWDNDLEERDNARLLTIKDLNARKIASDSAVLKWSPDETKFLYGQNPNTNLKVYDLETNKHFDIPPADAQSWLPNSRHIILVEENKISIVEFDGANKAEIYAGKFEDNFVFPWPDSSRLVMISSFPTPTASEPNLYGINLK
ncbi:PEGA domain-containing protein [Candidatus Daviesbacteria bacterium]|nr:PEGA domain-containing protein [Candidatus Daviesbacteria bacterium]